MHFLFLFQVLRTHSLYLELSKLCKFTTTLQNQFYLEWREALNRYQSMKEEFEDIKGVTRIHKWQKEKGQKDKQRSTSITHKTKDHVT